jgi:mannosyltransferase OCH1-like enzyme
MPLKTIFLTSLVALYTPVHSVDIQLECSRESDCPTQAGYAREFKFGAIGFEDSLKKSWQPGYGYQTFYDKPLWHLYVKHYEKNMPLSTTIASESHIPKIIHQIWLGSPLPAHFEKLQQTWKDKHPDWEFKLWTDENTKSLNLINRELFEAVPNYGEKSDILRYELLDQFGGLYCDVDFECLQPFDLLHDNLDFYTGLPGWRGLHLNNGIIGCTQGHPIIKKCISDLKANYVDQGGDWTINGVFARSGPDYFTKCVEALLDSAPGKNVVFPGSFFYPLPPLDDRSQRTHEHAKAWIQPESFCIHYWASSWLKNW